MNRKIKVLIVFLLPALVALTTMAFTFGTVKPIKLSSSEIEKITNMVNEFYDNSNCVAANLANSGQCSENLRERFFGGYDRMGCPIYNDFLTSSSLVSQYVTNGHFRNSFSYIRALQNTHVQTTLESVKPYGGEWTKILKQPKNDASDPDVYMVSVNVKKQLHYQSGDKGKTVNQTISFSLPGYTISGIHNDSPSSGSSSNTTNNASSGNYMARAFEHYANKEYNEALSLFEKQIALCEDPEAYYYAAIMYLKNQGCKDMKRRQRDDKAVSYLMILKRQWDELFGSSLISGNMDFEDQTWYLFKAVSILGLYGIY